MNVSPGKSFSIFIILLMGLTQVTYADNTAALIAHARSAAPPAISANATVMNEGKVLAKGNNGWVCLPGTMPGDDSPMCNDETWMQLMTALGAKAPFKATKIGISYMLKGDVGPNAGVSNSDPFHPDGAKAKDFVKEGPHLMIIVPPEMLEGITDDPKSGGPYVMWKDTPYAHIMIPVGKRM